MLFCLPIEYYRVPNFIHILIEFSFFIYTKNGKRRRDSKLRFNIKFEFYHIKGVFDINTNYIYILYNIFECHG